MKRRILLSQNGWEYAGKLDIEANSISVLPCVNIHGIAEKNKVVINGAILTFDEEVAPVCHGKEMDFITTENDWVCCECCKWQG